MKKEKLLIDVKIAFLKVSYFVFQLSVGNQLPQPRPATMPWKTMPTTVTPMQKLKAHFQKIKQKDKLPNKAKTRKIVVYFRERVR